MPLANPWFGCMRGKEMDQAKQQQLEAKGWKVSSVEEFLELTPEEASYTELKLALSESLRTYRKQRQLTQMDLAKLLKSSQSRVAKMEAGDPSVSLDLLVRSLLAMGASREALAQMITSSAAAQG
ncbi:MAG: helix-turn-helix domain-containing protein [Anaerolineae bacterium]